MSDIRAGTIGDAAGTGPITMTKQSPAKCFVLVSTSKVVLDSFNVTSITDTANGPPNEWRINLTSAMSDNNYTALATAQSSSDRTIVVINQSASQVRNYVYDGGGGSTSVVGQNAVFGELA